MKKAGKYVVCLFLLIAAFSCKKPYAPVIVSTDQSYMVVEGVINSGSDSTFIKLSRTIKLNSTKNVAESGAIVTVESDKNDTYPLTEVKTGIYSISNLNLPADRKYRLHILTSQNGEYVSDYVENKITPPLDSISYKPLASGVQFYVNTHDPNNNTRYYRWDYDETWTYFSLFNSQYIYKDHQLVFRNPDSLVNTCYRHATPSNSFYVDKTDGLSQDVVARFPIGYVAASSGKVTHVYSLNVKQYAITPDAFKFWQNLKKNTEQLGSIFDPFPSTSLGNIHAVADPNEIVLGFISVSTITSKRIFLAGRLLPFQLPRDDETGPPFITDCYAGFVPVAPEETLAARLDRVFATGDTLPTLAHVSKVTFKVDAYGYATKVCVDCRVIGGTNIKPPYWPDNL